MDVVQLAVLQSPEDVLHGVTTPGEIAGIPAEEVLFPVGQQLGIVQRPPATHDRIAFEIDVDAALLGLFEQLGVGGL